MKSTHLGSMVHDPLNSNELETPAALVDLERVRANVRRTAAYCREHGLAWRPHVKTHKTPELAALQVEAGAIGVTVATPAEAEVMAPAVITSCSHTRRSARASCAG